jgi:fatty-acyl-CoA synthase
MNESLVVHARQHALGDIPRRTARRVPDKLALIDGAVSLTFAQLDVAIDRTAAGLEAAGLAKGDRLAALSRNCWQYAVLSPATARLGAIFVPINFMLGPDEVAFILDHSAASVFVVEDGLIPLGEKALAASAGTTKMRVVIKRSDDAVSGGWTDVQDWIDFDGSAPQVIVGDDDPVRLMYTSGTESRPKGVLLSSRSLMWQYTSCVIDGGMAADDVELHCLPMYHCAQLDCFLLPDIYLGATSVILPGPEPRAILEAIERHRVTKFFAPPTVWISLLRCPDFDRTDLSSLSKGYYGASPMPVEILKEIQQRLPDLRLWNFYGQTEMAPLATILTPDEQLAHAGSAGRAALNVETRIVDGNDEPVAAGNVGEIVHRSPQATLGYYNQPEQTQDAFRNGWFHSGDLGYVDEHGRLYVVDRKKDMIKTGGENVASREVEEAIYAHPDVAEVAVFGVPHPTWVEAVAAVVVPKPGTQLEATAVISHARERLAGFKTPKYVVLAESLPRNPSGKILKRQLREEHTSLASD